MTTTTKRNASKTPKSTKASSKGLKGTAKTRKVSRKVAATKGSAGKKRDLFAELSEGLTALREEREGKRTLRTHEVEFPEPVEVTPAELREVRESLNVSRAVLAAYLRTNPRTLENWEQGRAQPNSQAALLICLVREYPDTIERLATL